MSTLQAGFDYGFNEVGAILGRQLGSLRGQVAALLSVTESRPSPSTTATSAGAAGGVRRGAARSRGAAATPASGLPLLAQPGLQQAKVELRRLAKDLDEIRLNKLAEPDYEAMEHEAEHQDGAASVDVKRETQQEKLERERILDGLKKRLQVIRQMLGLRTMDA